MKNLFYLFYESSGISIDTRTVQADNLFVALKGENFNGNDYAKKALVLGAKFAVVDEPSVADNKTIFYVQNTLIFLQKLANFHRHKFNIPIIGITGSNGKTSTKELINAVLSKKFNVLCTKGNLNNHIGVPLTLLQLTREHQIAIIEMGANKPGDIKELAEIAQPNFGIITNIGKAHLEGFINFEGVLKTKLELFDFISSVNGKFVLNADDKILTEATKNFKNNLFYGVTDTANIRGNLEKLTPFIVLNWSNKSFQSPSIVTSMIGNYNFYNFLAAIAFGKLFNVENNLINEAIATYNPSNSRSQVLKTDKNLLIVDCYNANPSSMLAALESFNLLENKEKLAILGDMLELGNESLVEHQKILSFCLENDIEFITIGPIFYSLNKKGYNSTHEFLGYLKDNKYNDKTILLKGSRGIALELLIQDL